MSDLASSIMRSCVAVTLFTFGCLRPAQPEPATSGTLQHVADAFQQTLDSLRITHGFPGATAAFALSDGTVVSVATGLADVESQRKMTPSTRMLAASIGKTFVAATIVDVTRDGALDLDAPVSKWLGGQPWFRRMPNHDSITLRHLLGHRAGLPDHVHDSEFQRDMASTWQKSGNAFPPERLIEYVADSPALFVPGEGWSYSDTGYLIAGLAVEEAIGRSLFDLVDERILTPFQLSETGPSNATVLTGLASGYAAENAFGFPRKTTMDDGQLVWHPGTEWAGGGLISTSADLARWGVLLYGGRVLPDLLLQQVLDGHSVDESLPDVLYGLGVAIYSDTPVGPVLGHGGWIPGYVSSLRYYQDHRLAIAVQINTDEGMTDGDVLQVIDQRLAAVVIEAL